MLQKTCFRAWFIAVFLAQPFHLARNAAAQNPIRVQSDEVLVPTVVFDKELYAKLNKQEPHHRTTYGKMVAKNAKLWNEIVVKNITAKDFHLFEDDQEQKIGSVKLEPPAFRVVQDNFGKHPETVGSGGGIWAYPDRPASDQRTWLALPQYVIAYVPPRSAPGSCHQIQVKVQGRHLVAWSRSEYCNTPHPASDPLNGTEFGKKMEAAAKPGAMSDIDMKMKASVFADNANGARVYVTMNFPSETLAHEVRNGKLYTTIGTLLLVYKKDGTLAARFSDFACCDYGNEKERSNEIKLSDTRETASQSLLPDRYETQFTLPAGEYEIRVALSDGIHFGVQEAALKVESYDARKLGMSDVVLSRRVRRVPTDTTEGAERVADSYTPMISKDVEFMPTANVRFFQDDTLFTYFEINDPLVKGQPDAKVQANMRIVDTKTEAVVDTFAPVDTATYSKAGSPVIAMGRGVPLKGLPAGVYRLDVQANNREGKSTEWSSSVFTVMELPPLLMSGATEVKKPEVIVNVTALDENGKAVPGLTSADFQIFEDEKEQTITSFQETSAVKLGAHFSASVVILFDLLNSYAEEHEYVADRIIKTLQPLDTEEGIYVYLLTNVGALVAVRPKGTPQAAAIAQGSIAGGSSEKAEEGPPWTKDIRPLLENAINQVNGFRLDAPRQASSSLTFQKLDELASAFAIIRGPKTLLWVTSGVPLEANTPYGCKDAVIYRDTSSYVAGKCSQDCPRPATPDMASLVVNCLDYTPFLKHFSAEAAESDSAVSSVAATATGLQDFVPGRSANLLKQLGDLTGGHVYLNTNREMEKAVREAVEGSKGRYRIGYAARAKDGKYRKWRVVCTREGVHVVAPQGYFAHEP